MKPALTGLLMLTVVTLHAQTAVQPLDQSPMDMSYYPVNYPVLRIQHKADAPPVARVIYGRPQKNHRVIFGDLVPYGSVWRLGANEATEIEFFRDVKIAGRKVPKGRYTLYAIPDTDRWTLILNKDTDTWGAFGYDAKQDVLRQEEPVKKLGQPLEALTICFEGEDRNKTSLRMAWDDREVFLPISW
jgi:hypothetical protein